MLSPAFLRIRGGGKSDDASWGSVVADDPHDDYDFEEDEEEDGDFEDGDEYDEAEDEDDLEYAYDEDDDYSPKKRRDPPSYTGPKNTYDHRLTGPPRQSQQRQRGRRPSKPKSHWTTRMAKQSVKVTSDAAWKTLAGSGKLAYSVLRPKHVDPAEVDGLWRLDQQITLPSQSQGRRPRRNGKDDDDGRTIASVATIEFESKHRVVKIKSIQDHTKTLIQPYRFYVTKLGYRKMQFTARAFLIGENKARMYGYKGTWERKMADRSVLKLVGKIYELKPTRRGRPEFGKQIGTFVARRRVRLNDDDLDDDDDFDDDFDHGDDTEVGDDDDDGWGDNGDDTDWDDDDDDF